MTTTQSSNHPILERCRDVVRAVQFEQAQVPAWRKVLGATSMTGFLAGSFLLQQRLAKNVPLEVDATCRHGARLRCRLPDAIQWCIYLYGIWEPDITAFVASRLRPGDLFVDVGAHIGYFSLLASRCVGETGSVVAIEASPSTFNQLQENLGLNGVRNVRAINMAASDRTERVPLYQGPEATRGWATITTQEGGSRVVEAQVDAAPLKDLLTPDELKKARLIKIDVEGAEESVLAGLATSLEQVSPETELLVELTPRLWKSRRSIEAVLEPYLAAGFRAYSLENDYMPWRFLWPSDVRPPRRIVGPVRPRALDGQIDLLLSRREPESV